MLAKSEIFLDLGEQIQSDGMEDNNGIFNPTMSSNATSLSVGYQLSNIPLFISLGYTHKDQTQHLASSNVTNNSGEYSNSNLYDISYQIYY